MTITPRTSRSARRQSPDPAATPAPVTHGPWSAAPADADALHALLATHLDLHVPRRPIITGHHAPFDYLVHSFFEGRRSWNEPAPPAPVDSVVWACRGGGKTFLGAVATMLDLVFKERIEVRILGGSLEQSRRMHAHLRALFSRPALAELVEGEITERRLRLRNGSGAELLAQSHPSVRGTRVQKLRCDEVELFDPGVWEAAQLATRSESLNVLGRGRHEIRGSIECLSTMHLPHGLMHRLVAEARRGTRRLFRWGLVDVLEPCPPRHACREGDEQGRAILALDPAQDLGPPRPGDCPLLEDCRARAKASGAGHLTIDDARAMKSRVSPSTWQSEMLCRRASTSLAVFPEFDRAVHVVDEVPPHSAMARWVAGMDFGFRAPTVILWAAVDHEGTLWIVDERVRAEVRLPEHVRALEEAPWPRPEWIGADPAGRQADGQTGVRDSDVLRRAGFRVLDRAFRRRDGLDLVAARLSPAPPAPTPRLFIHRRCTVLAESLERYRYDPARPESDEPVKDGHDHACDALRYLVQNLDRPVRTVTGSYTP